MLLTSGDRVPPWGRLPGWQLWDRGTTNGSIQLHFQVGSCEAALYGPQVTFGVLPLSLLGSAGSPCSPSWSQLQIGSIWLVIPWL